MGIRLTVGAVGGFAGLVVLATIPLWAHAAPGNPSKMSIDNMVKDAGVMVRKMEEILTKSFKELEGSIAEGDVGATTARNEAITAMKGLVKLSEENYRNLQQKAAEGDRETVEHEYVKISIAYAKVGELFAQVRTAGGIKVDLEATDVSLTLDIDSAMTFDPVLTSPSLDQPQALPDPPVHASPYF